MNYQLRLAVAPAEEPLLVGGGTPELDVLTHLRLDTPAPGDAAYLKNLIAAARRWAENATSRCFIEQTWDLLLPAGFPCSWGSRYVISSNEIRIPRAPLKATGGIVSVKYLDTGGTQQPLAAGTDYVLARSGEMALLLPAYGKSWPTVRAWPDAGGNYPVEVRFLAGYGTDGKSVPENFRQAMLLLVGHWHENREEVTEGALSHVPLAAEALLSQDVFVPW